LIDVEGAAKLDEVVVMQSSIEQETLKHIAGGWECQFTHSVSQAAVVKESSIVGFFSPALA